MAVPRSLAIALAAVVLAGYVGAAPCAAAETANITVIQIRATQGDGPKQVDPKLSSLRAKLVVLPYHKFDLVGRFQGNAAYDEETVIALAEGFSLKASPRKEPGRRDRIGLGIAVLKGGRPLLFTSLLVRPGGVGFLTCPSADGSATILAVSAR